MSLPTEDEKGAEIETHQRSINSSPPLAIEDSCRSDNDNDIGNSNDNDDDNKSSTIEVDTAWQFISNNSHVSGIHQVDLKSLRRRIDWHIVPLMFCCYTMQFLDKITYNYASAMGIITDLDLTGNRFSSVATFLFIGFLCFEIPNVPPAKWLGLNVILWGIATACGAAAHNYPGILASRIFLGIFEATIGPSLAVISSQWYTKSEQAPRFSIWYLGLGFGQILGGFVSWGFQHVAATAGTPSTGGLAGWRIMFIALGGLTILVGLAVIFIVPDDPTQAKWMTVAEKVALLRHVSVNQTGVRGSTRFRRREMVDALTDPQIWLLVLPVLLIAISSGVVTTYSVRLVSTITYDPHKTKAANAQHATLMNTPSGAVSIFFTLLVGFGVRMRSHRWAWILACIIPAIIGGALMSFLPSTNQAGLLVGVYLVNAVVGPMPIQYSWMMANVAGATKRAFSVALLSAAFSIGNIIGPQTFRAKDAPDYRPAKLVLLSTQAASAVITIFLFLYYVWANRGRVNRPRQTEDQFMDRRTWLRMTDRENKTFRYEY